MASLDTAVAGLDGVQVDYVAATGSGDDCETGPGVLLLVNNADTSPHTVTLVTPREVDGLAISDREIVVSDGVDQAIPVGHEYRDPSTGRATINYDAVTDVNVAVIRVAT